MKFSSQTAHCLQVLFDLVLTLSGSRKRLSISVAYVSSSINPSPSVSAYSNAYTICCAFRYLSRDWDSFCINSHRSLLFMHWLYCFLFDSNADLSSATIISGDPSIQAWAISSYCSDGSRGRLALTVLVTQQLPISELGCFFLLSVIIGFDRFEVDNFL